MEMVIYNAFRKAGVADSDAQTIAADLTKNLNDAIENHYAVHSQQVATKGDTEQLRLEIEHLRRETKVDIEKVRAEVEKVRGEIEKAKFTIIGSIVAIAGISLAVARFIFTAG